MDDSNKELAQRVRDIIAVVTDDIDGVMFEVEDGVAYIEGVVPSDQERKAISSAVRQLDGLTHVITCLATEKVIPPPENSSVAPYPTPVLMHHHSLS